MTIRPTPLMQSAGMEAALHTIGRPGLRLADGALAMRRRVAGLPVAMLSRVDLADPAPLLADPGLAGHWVILGPEAPASTLWRIGALPLVSPATVALLPLSLDSDAMRRALHGKWRNRLRHAECQGLRIRHGPLSRDAGHWLLRAEVEQARARRYLGWPTELTLAFARVDRKATILFEARGPGDAQAAMLFFRHGSTATYHIGHTNAAARVCSAHNALMWKAIVWLAGAGHSWLDLGQVDTEGAPGLARFKLGTGAFAHRLGGTWLWHRHATPLLAPLARIDRRMMAA